MDRKLPVALICLLLTGIFILCACHSDIERAAKSGDTEKVKILLARDNYRVPDDYDKKNIDKAIAQAIEKGHIDTLKILIDKVEDINPESASKAISLA